VIFGKWVFKTVSFFFDPQILSDKDGKVDGKHWNDIRKECVKTINQSDMAFFQYEGKQFSPSYLFIFFSKFDFSKKWI
jgi:hypothetical protein